ncbi:3-hydroxyacyl-CoA dehydrogenase [Mesorhizobium robiniae]|uniref:3-hydroxyacyl-CoA dehydrogenase n=1 Tax=Mesorhizobium robiniae TaxID=559315 RepID=A0ABV2GZU9_9HYPH|nr:3-hydroxyacyl-CoA dehydrogenase NAD-binding domain-containing protein [Mesorhizobium sp. ZC-5]MCV3244058.1 3-hydroxyacyl-CoA dehydrogenase NAD-binding domain-containing protein [Mesorhizobium sp. ZC-5]
MTESKTPQVVRLGKQDGVGIIVIDNPPINAGSLQVRLGLLKAIQAVDSDPSLSGGILIGASKMFMAGSDIREFGAQLEDPQLPSVIAAIEKSAKPFVAAIAGAALGGGYELALACDGRIASVEAVVGLPETTLGLIPGAGGTQRLPRLVGREKAIEFICAGSRLGAEQALKFGMIDAVAQGDLLTEALKLLSRFGSNKRRVTSIEVPDSDPVALQNAKTEALKGGRNRPHIHAAISAIDHCGRLSVTEGLVAERAQFQKLRMGREAAALRHLFFAERRALRVPELAATMARPIRVVAVIGGGTMGAGIAAAMLSSGKSVSILENTAEAVKAARDRVRKIFQWRLDRGRLRAEELEHLMCQLDVTTLKDPIGKADAVIEAVFEDVRVKRQIFALLGEVARPDAILLTNTSYLSVAEIAASSGRPQSVAGMHFFSPAEKMRLVEIVRHSETSPEVLASAYSLAIAAGKLPVLSNDSFGFIGNRIYASYRRQCEYMLEEGALPQQVDKALEEFGFAMGPFAVADMSGLDIAWRMRQATAAGRDPMARYARIPDLLCEMGRFGRKTGAGYYRYTEAAGPGQVDQAITDLVTRTSSEAGRVRRLFSPSEIVARALAAMASEAALVISEGVTNSRSDVDLVLTNGYGFPKHEGGIVFWARNQPKAELEAAFSRLIETQGPHYQVGPISALSHEDDRKSH